MLDWLKFLQIRGLKSCWIAWMLYSDMGSSPLQVALEWLNALRLHGFKSSPSSAGLVECFTATCVQVPFKSCWICWMLYRYVGSSPLQFMQDWLNDLQLCGFKCPPSHGGLIECFTATWVQVPFKSCWICWMLYRYVGSSPLQFMLDWLNTLQLCGFKFLQVMLDWSNALQIHGLKSCWIAWMLYSYMGSSPLQVTLDWLNALQLHGFKSPPS